MLFEPDKDLFAQMLVEVTSPGHPEHIQSGGPEQDYLSRYFAGQWTHIGLQYNYQLHHLLFSVTRGRGHSTRWAMDPAEVKVVHYSSQPKPHAFLGEGAAKEFAEIVLGGHIPAKPTIRRAVPVGLGRWEHSEGRCWVWSAPSPDGDGFTRGWIAFCAENVLEVELNGTRGVGTWKRRGSQLMDLEMPSGRYTAQLHPFRSDFSAQEEGAETWEWPIRGWPEEEVDTELLDKAETLLLQFHAEWEAALTKANDEANGQLIPLMLRASPDKRTFMEH